MEFTRGSPRISCAFIRCSLSGITEDDTDKTINNYINDMTHTQKCMLMTPASSSSSTNFIAMQVLKKTSGPLTKLHGIHSLMILSVRQREPVKTVQHTVSPFTTVTAYLIFDRSNIALLSPVNRVWKIELHVRRQVG